MALLLFDIDGTLLAPRGLGRRAFEAALRALYGRLPETAFPYDGLMDVTIAERTLALLGEAPTPEAVSALLAEYARRLPAEAPAGDDGHLCPGVPSVLDEARARGHQLGLLTGNLAATAAVKLGFFGLGGHFPAGAYAGDGPDRASLVPVAQARCARVSGRPFGHDETWLVGDSVHDVRAARQSGVRCAAVATGNTPAEALSAEGPDLLLPDLGDTRPLWAAVEGPR